MNNIENPRLKKVLLIRYSAIGDIILTTPVARWIKLQLNAEVHYLTDHKNSKLLANNIYIDEIISSTGSVSKDRALIKAEDYAIVIDLHKSRRSRLTTLFLPCKILTFDKLNIRKWIAVNLKLNTLPNTHLVDRYADCLIPIGIKNDENGLDYFISESTFVENLPDKFNVLILGAAHFTKRIPLNKCSEIIEESPLPVVLLGGSDVTEIALSLSSNSKVIDYTNKLTIDQSAFTINKAETIVTGDTGMMHIAAALKKKIILLWGNTTPKFGMSPYYGKINQMQYSNMEVDLKCRPCSKIGFKSCPKGHHKCMNDQKIADIFKEAT